MMPIHALYAVQSKRFIQSATMLDHSEVSYIHQGHQAVDIKFTHKTGRDGPTDSSTKISRLSLQIFCGAVE